jgi:hypothetical protein
MDEDVGKDKQNRQNHPKYQDTIKRAYLYHQSREAA